MSARDEEIRDLHDSVDALIERIERLMAERGMKYTPIKRREES